MNRIVARSVASACAVALLVGLGAVGCEPGAFPDPPPCDLTWVGPDAGAFSDPANWTPSVAPSASDRVCSSGGTSIVVDATSTVRETDLEGTVTIPSGITLTVLSTSDLSGISNLHLSGTLDGDAPQIITDLDLDGGRIGGTGITLVLDASSSSLSSGTFDGSRDYALGGTVPLNGPISICDSANVHVSGVMTANSGAAISSSGCGTVVAPQFSIDNGGTLVAGATLAASSMSILNSGTIAGTGTLEAATVVNQGTIDMAAGGSIDLSASAGSVQLDGGTLTGVGSVVGNVVGHGAIASPPTDTLTIIGDVNLSAPSTVLFTANGVDGGTDYGVVAVTGAVDLSQTVFSATLNYTPSAYDLFFPLSSGAVSIVDPASTSFPTLTPLYMHASNGGSAYILYVDNCDPAIYHPGADLSGQSLTGLDLASCDLTGSTLTSTDLTYANLNSAYLGSVSAVGALFDGATLDYATFNGADLTGASLANASIEGADLQYVNFTDANLTGASGDPTLGDGNIYSNTTCPSGLNSDLNGGTCDEQWGGGGGGG